MTLFAVLERDLPVWFKAAPALWVALLDPRDVLFIEASALYCVWLVAAAAAAADGLLEFCEDGGGVRGFDWFSVPVIVWLYETVIFFSWCIILP